MRNILLAVVAATGLVGCVGGIDTNPTPIPSDPPAQGVGGGTSGPGAQAARTSFETNVYPIISAAGRCVGCHSSSGPVGNVTGFVAPAATDGYVTAVGYQALVGDWTPAGAPILTKIAAGHNGQTYTDAEKGKITDWLTAELTARAAGGGTGTGSGTPGAESPADATLRLTKQWSGCMTQTNFNTANMVAWATMRADNSQCQTCHVDGEYGQIATNVPTTFFNVISTNKYYMAQYFTVDLSKGVAAAQVIVNTRSFTGVGTDLPPHVEHPRFNPTNSAGMTALNKFYTLTMANLTAGTCGPPTLTN